MNGAVELAGALDGAAALPRRNGELVFAEPWESSAFGMAVALCEAGVYEWDEFRDAIERIPPQEYLEASYYERWLRAVETLLAEKGVLAGE